MSSLKAIHPQLAIPSTVKSCAFKSSETASPTSLITPVLVPPDTRRANP